ncbi:histone-lysine N-methyltransferase set-1-like [Cottoperca gobio]|uniref:Histone-lysine N-methyltransferase set-1-like n=1 Tax=Cottoperca gobio TaxID=56716 RepID=A0A6J2P8A6_COTGO|nr:histone-lysine N-methyltransferase set-1-like [Cottoperca gobio]
MERRRRLHPQQDAEKHIQLKTDKAGLTEHFINPYKGRGVLATKEFNQGDFMLEYRGKLFKQDHHTNYNYNDTEAVFLFDFKWNGKCWCLDASVEDKSLGRLVNDDQKKPNCKMKIVGVGGMPHLCMFALRHIAPEEEITYNYGDADWPWRKQVTNEQATAEKVETERLPLDVTSHEASNDDGATIQVIE